MRNTIFTTIVLVLLLSLTTGCGVFRAPQPPGFNSIALEGVVDRNRKDVPDGDLAAYSTLKGVGIAVASAPAVGFASGVVGLGVSSAVCLPSAGATGPFAVLVYPFCVGAWTGISAIGGFGVGLVGGVTYAIIGGLPSETADAITELLARVEDDGSLDAMLLAAIAGAIPAERQAGPETAEGRVVAKLDDIDLRQHSKDHLSFRLNARMVQIWTDEEGKPRDKTCNYRHDTDRIPAETWLENGTEGFRAALTEGFEAMSAWMNRDLEAFANKTEFDETDSAPGSCYRGPRWYDWMSPF